MWDSYGGAELPKFEWGKLGQSNFREYGESIMASKLGQFTKYSLTSLGSQFFVLIVSLATSVITARALGPEGKGQLVLILLIPLLSLTFGGIGLGHAVNYYAKRVSSTKLILTSFILSIFLGILLLILLLPVVTVFKDIFFNDISGKRLLLISFAVPFFLLTNCLFVLMQGLYKINKMNLIMSSQSIIFLAFILLLVVIFKKGVDGAIIAWIISLFFTFFLSMLVILREIKLEEISLRLDLSFVKKMLRFGFRTHIGNILKDLSYRGDILIVGYFLTPASVGCYAIAVSIAEIVLKIPNAIGLVLLPRVSQMNKKDAKSFTPIVCRRVLLPVVSICIIFSLFSEKIVYFAFGKEYLPSSPALVLLIPGILALSLWKILANDIIAQGHPFKYSLTSALALLTMIVMDLFLIPKFGINGAAIASSTSYISATAAIIFFYRKITKNTFKSLLVPLKSDFVFYKNLIIRPKISNIAKS